MAREIQLPELGENIDTAIVGGVLVSPGDTIAKDQPLIEVETDKATAEVPSPVAGVVKAVRVASGDEIKVGQVIVVVEETGEAKAAPEAEPKPEPRPEPKPEPAPEPKPEPEPAPPPREPARAVSEEASSIPAAPAVRRLARELGVDLSTLPGTGPGGRITLEDVKEHARDVVSGGSRPAPARGASPAGAPKLPDFTAWGKVRRETMTGIERKTAEAMALSGSVIPQVTQFDQADVTELESWRKRFVARAGKDDPKLTVTAIVLKVVAGALRKFPRFNASLDVEAGEIVYKESIHLGVAVDAPQGLLVPVIRDADTKGVLALARELAELSARAKTKKLSVDEMRGATFTITNLGGLGTLHFSPIVNWPEAAILGIGRATPTVVEIDGSFVTRTILPLSLSYDHRLINGADAARFERWIAEALEQALTLVLEG